MPHLGDFIGQLIAELTISRMQADLESIRIAELYANHPLLKHFAVPRFRLPNVTLKVPVAVTDIEEFPIGKEPRGGLRKIPELMESITRTINSQLQKSGVTLPEENLGVLKKKLEEITIDLTKIKEVPVNLSFIADKIAGEVMSNVRNVEKEKFQPNSNESIELHRQIQFSTRYNFLSFMESPPRLRVIANTKDLSEIKESDRLIRLDLTITEDAVEWVVIKTDEKDQYRLVPE